MAAPPIDRRRLRWLARCLTAIDLGPESHRLAILAACQRVVAASADIEAEEAMADTLGVLLLDALDCKPEAR